ncbi:hypothetical protein BSKO_06101 [Bryopsis sp. KO-2023]|nr:hypothetical protein BSKO_06101 [Bryopsis sp. KO-2023]
MLSTRLLVLLLCATAFVSIAYAAPPPLGGSAGLRRTKATTKVVYGEQSGNRQRNLEGAEKYLLGDFNGDGRTDILSFRDKFVVFLASVNGAFDEEEVFSGDCYGGKCSDIIWGTFAEDFNGNGVADILHFGKNLDVWIAKGNGSFHEHHKASAASCYGRPCWELPPVHLGDFDGDGMTDIMHLGQNIDVWLAKGDGTFKTFEWTEDVCYGRPCWELPRVFAGDFNGDAVTDILNIGYNLDVWLSEGNGHFGSQHYTDGGCYGGSCEKMWKVFVGDFDGDGKTDVLNLGDGLDVWLSKGDGTFHGVKWTSGVCDGPCYSMSRTAIADFDGDSSMDVLNIGTSLDVFLSKGDGTFKPRVSTSCGEDCKHCTCVKSVRTGDFNGDGNADAVGFSQDGELVVVWLSKGDGTFSEPEVVLNGDYRDAGHLPE